MSTTTLQQLLAKGTASSADRTQVEAAIAAAYWAGQTDGIRQEREKVSARIHTLPPSRWHRFQARIVNLLTPPEELRAIPGLRDDAAEIKAWDFAL